MNIIPLQPTDNAKEWLYSNLKDLTLLSGTLLKEKKELKKFMDENFKGEKGIYFWFLKVESLELFLNCIPKSKIDDDSSYLVNFEDSKYILVYLGTAGVRKNKNEKNNSNLLDRLNWHLFNTQTEKSVSSGAMSTLRRTLGALISNDLIAEKTQSKLTEIINENFIIYFLPYGKETAGKEYLNIQKTVSENETILIENLKPIFNLSQNPNEKKNSNHITHVISKRRKKVEIDTKERLALKFANAVSKSKKGIQKNASKSENSRIKNGSGIYNDRLQQTEDGCFVFHVKKNESIHDVIKNLDLKLPEHCYFVLSNSIEKTELVYPPGHFGMKRSTTRLKKYFGTSDENYSKENNYESIIRYKFIQEEMSRRNIAEVTVSIYPINKSNEI
jgi:hypothetical protein